MPTFGLTMERNSWSPRSEEFYNQLLVGLGDEVIGQGHMVIVEIVAGREEELATYARWARDGSVDVVLCKDIGVGDDLEDRLLELGLAHVVLGDTRQPVRSNAVAVDNAAGLREAIDYLRAAGHRRIDWITGPAVQFHTHVRMEVFADYLSEGLIEGVAAAAEYDPERCRELITAALQRDHPPTAFLVDGDFLATVAVDCLRRNGRDVPAEVSVVSWDDSLTCQRADPPISALQHHIADLGHAVGRCLIAAVEGRELRELGPRPQLVIRASSS
ncbi:MAG TPA: substrate-binding domain-containing protein [Microlunatus sp.]